MAVELGDMITALNGNPIKRNEDLLCLVEELCVYDGNIDNERFKTLAAAAEVRVPLVTAKRRPIGLFRGYTRVLSRIRKPVGDAWERGRAAKGFFNSAPGVWPADGVWRAKVKATVAREKDSCPRKRTGI